MLSQQGWFWQSADRPTNNKKTIYQNKYERISKNTVGRLLSFRHCKGRNKKKRQELVLALMELFWELWKFFGNYPFASSSLKASMNALKSLMTRSGALFFSHLSIGSSMNLLSLMVLDTTPVVQL